MGCEPNTTRLPDPAGGDRTPDAPATPDPPAADHIVRAGPPQYLVGGGTPALLAALAGEIEADPRVSLLRIVGPAKTPSLLVATMSHDTAGEYQARYRGLATIEEDSPLGL